MNAPYDGDRGQGAGGAASPGGPPVPPGAGQDGSVPPDPYLQQPDPYLQHAYDDDPYRAQDLTAQDPVGEALDPAVDLAEVHADDPGGLLDVRGVVGDDDAQFLVRGVEGG
ncbi:hypothetical protein, partial [Streptomyces parvus]|uniref:hypothetical protein n=1 Tax=Streptomyces parvus TaxID=66428 RepID=UPI001FCA8DBC